MKNRWDLFNTVDEFYGKKSKIEDTIVIASQHLLWTQLEMFKRLLSHNLDSNKLYIIGKNYSTNREVFETLQQTGAYIDPSSIQFNPNKSFDSQFDNNIEQLLDKVEQEHHIDKHTCILLDDWWHLIEIAQKKWRNEKYKLLGIEQTSSGYHKIKDLDLDYLNVARSNTKLIYETPFIGDLWIERIMESIKKHDIQDPNCLIVWCWPIGESILMRLRNLWISYTWFDNKHTYQKILSQTSKIDISEKHFLDFYQKNIKKFNMIVWSTGSNILSFEKIKHLWPKVALISMSSSDREFPAVEIRTHADTTTSEIHSDRNYKNITLINSWFPITFQGNYHESPPEIIELTIALLYAGVLHQNFKNNEKHSTPWFNILNARLVEWFKRRLALHKIPYKIKQ